MITSKVCRRCKIDKPVSELKKDTRNGDNYSCFCKQCHRDSSEEWQRNNPEKVKAARNARYSRNKEKYRAEKRLKYDPEKSRWSQLKGLYKVTKVWYDNQMEAQNNSCAICKRKKEEFTGRFVIDHDHSCCKKTPTCGKCTRGILCHSCNISIYSVETINDWSKLAEEYLNGTSSPRIDLQKND